jgi:hypothetical protein
VPRTSAVLVAAALAVSSGRHAEEPKSIRLLFTGDIMLSRQVQLEMQTRKLSPWMHLGALFGAADWVGGNLEGALGPASQCIPHAASPCFATPASAVVALKEAGFDAVSIENNHAGDLGATGREATRAAFEQHGLLALDFASSPRFLRFGETTVALLAVTTVGGVDGQAQEVPSVALAQKLRLARGLANVVVVSIHWGSELLDWPTDAQREQGAWLVRHGADVVLGHHPHVVQAPECLQGKPIFFSLGNHVFDQKYPQTKDGMIADCRVGAGHVRCEAIRTHTDPATSIPRPVGPDERVRVALSQCAPAPAADLVVDGVTIRPQPWTADQPPDGLVLEGWKQGRIVWRSRRQRLLSLEVAPLEGPLSTPLLFTLERHASSLDDEDGIRPYVYAVGRRGLVAKWRGSALAWPLLDAVLGPMGEVCALHRPDSFVAPQPGAKGSRVAAYRWNGFGFDGIANARCEARLD